ncbi:low molecular weight protein-tyrosine-phosphatase [Dryocola sp. BD626]|uniref:low molecular weight protein-tyrosine-phosphatase n=1 Tax=Dryocola sp. BD626 TaxID=3133273 RepID=UPI003F50A545
MVKSILVVCTGNICRSPVARWQLIDLLPHIEIHSAGLNASSGLTADATMSRIANENGIKNLEHSSQKFTLAMGSMCDLILAMEASQLTIISQQYPQLSGKSRLLTYWNGRKDIPDPYQKSNELYRAVYQRISDATMSWKKALQA